nr:hypothetical protein JVH1_1211 [Rhodococcus sp. JVH1]
MGAAGDRTNEGDEADRPQTPPAEPDLGIPLLVAAAGLVSMVFVQDSL